METARSFDLTRTPLVRAIFWLRGVILRGHAAVPDWSRGFLHAMQKMGWGVLAESADRWLLAGTVCQPWLADVRMTPLSQEKAGADRVIPDFIGANLDNLRGLFA